MRCVLWVRGGGPVVRPGVSSPHHHPSYSCLLLNVLVNDVLTTSEVVITLLSRGSGTALSLLEAPCPERSGPLPVPRGMAPCPDRVCRPAISQGQSARHRHTAHRPGRSAPRVVVVVPLLCGAAHGVPPGLGLRAVTAFRHQASPSVTSDTH